LAAVDREVEIAEVGLAEDRGDQGGDQVLDQGLDDRSEGRPDDDADREVDDVPSQQKRLESAHGDSSCRSTGGSHEDSRGRALVSRLACQGLPVMRSATRAITEVRLNPRISWRSAQR